MAYLFLILIAQMSHSNSNIHSVLAISKTLVEFNFAILVQNCENKIQKVCSAEILLLQKFLPLL